MKSEQMQRTASKLHDILPFSYFVIDRQFIIQSASSQALSTFPAAANFLDLIDPGSKRKAAKFMVENPSITKFELNFRTKDNPLALFDVYIRYDAAQLIHVFCIDKEEQLQQVVKSIHVFEQQLTEANHSLQQEKAALKQSLENLQELTMKHDNLATVGKLAASVAHEIRNPLTSVRGFIQLLKPHLLSIGKEYYADIALEELDRANDIIYEFLNASKPAAPVIHTFSVLELVKDMILLCQSEALIRNCQIVLDYNDCNSFVQADKKQLKQVLLNLLKNAMEAIQDSPNRHRGIVSIALQEDEHTVTARITDNGKGMSSELLNNVFTPFFTTKESGTGIGLAVCAKIIQAHHGAITVDSTPGLGSVFTIQLPRIHT